MSLIDGKCPNCGANIKIDPKNDAGICEYCGSAFVTEKAIVNFGTYIQNQEVHNVKEDNEWTYKATKEKSDNMFWIGWLIFMGFFAVFVAFMLTKLL